MNGLKNKLAGLYAIFGAAILMIILLSFGAVIYQKGMNDAGSRMKVDLDRYLHMLQTENTITDSFLKEEEQYSGYAIFLFYGKFPFRFPGEYVTGEEREELLRTCLSSGAGYKKPTKLKSGGVPYLVYRGETGDGSKGLYLCMELTQLYRSFLAQFAILFLCFLCGSGALVLLGRFLAERAAKPVEENQKEQAAFIRAAGHELRSPLAVIRANNAAAGVDAERQAHYQQVIDDECERMGRLVEDLLTLAKGTGGGYDLKEERFAADTFLIECFEKYEPVCRQDQIPLHISLPEEAAGTIKGDRQRLEQAVGILIHNALSYGATEKGIELGLWIDKKQIVLWVRDHGPGIADERKEKVFERFYRGDESRTDKEHFGLGLSIARELVQAMGGSIEAVDTPGGGAEFRIKMQIKTNKN